MSGRDAELPLPHDLWPGVAYLISCAGMQVIEEAQPPLSKWYRHVSKGAWPFSSRDHGWPISDCSSEGLKAALILASLPASKV